MKIILLRISSIYIIGYYRFNRIDVEVLSVVAQQLLTIKTAKDAHAQRFVYRSFKNEIY